MPAFESKTISGNPVISGAYEGHKLVVSFVSTKCPECEQTLSAANSVYQDNRDLVVVGVFQKDHADGAVPVASRLSLRFPIVVDHDGSISRQFQIGDAVPSTFVVDSGGRVRWVGGSELTSDALDRAVQSAP
jgi:peroxiredoxin